MSFSLTVGALEAVGVAVSGVGGAVDSVRAETGVLCLEEERRSRLLEVDFGPEVPFLEAGAMLGEVCRECVLARTSARFDRAIAMLDTR